MHARSLHWAKRSFVTPVWPLIRPCRSTKRIAKTFQLDVTRLDPAAALTSVKGIDFRLGLVWMPSSQVVLSGNARAAIRQRMLFHCRTREEGLGQAIGKVPLDEVAGSVAHRLVGARDFRTLVREGRADELICMAEDPERRKKSIHTPGHLEDTYLP